MTTPSIPAIAPRDARVGSPRPSRPLALVGLFVSMAALLVSVGLMSRKVNAYYATSEHTLWMFDPVSDREFTYAGRPVSITDEDTPDGRVVVNVRYGDSIERINATIPPLPAQVPGLARHQDWFRALRFAEHGKRDFREAKREIDAGEIKDRMVLVVRRPPPGMNPDALGRVAQKEWMFDLYELKPEGGFAIQRLGWPESEREARARGASGQGPNTSKLQEGTWQYYAALMVMPIKPTPRFTGDAVRAMGWTLPSASFSALAVVASVIALTSAGRRARSARA